MYSVRTDLAIEAREIYRENIKQETDIPGTDVETSGDDKILITRVKVISDEAVKIIGKPIGDYITIEVPNLKNKDKLLGEETSKVVSQELSKLIKIDKEATVLIVGLGNWNVTPDALGPKVVSSLMVTRHLLEYVPEEVDEGVRPVCAIAPGVLGLTGIETGEIIKGVIDKIKPAIVIAIDALASRRMDRISTTIQISNTGISPGSGIGNKRMSLNEQSLGVPVIAMGIPTVVDAATVANDSIDLVIDSIIKEVDEASEFYKILKKMTKDEKFLLIQEALSPYVGNLIVTPKEIDSIVQEVSKIIANGINIALHDGIGFEDINRYIDS